MNHIANAEDEKDGETEIAKQGEVGASIGDLDCPAGVHWST